MKFFHRYSKLFIVPFIITLSVIFLAVIVLLIYNRVRWNVYYQLENSDVSMFFGEKDGNFACNLRKYYFAHPDNAYDDMPKFLKYDRFVPLAISVPEGFQDWELLHDGLLKMQETTVLLNLGNSSIDDHSLQLLLSTKAVWALILMQCTNITVDSLKFIARQECVETLFLSETGFSDNDILCLNSSSIRHLVLNKTKVTGICFSEKWNSLKFLNVTDCPVNSIGFHNILKVPSLTGFALTYYDDVCTDVLSLCEDECSVYYIRIEIPQHNTAEFMDAITACFCVRFDLNVIDNEGKLHCSSYLNPYADEIIIR